MKMLRTNQPGGTSRLKNCCMIYDYFHLDKFLSLHLKHFHILSDFYKLY